MKIKFLRNTRNEQGNDRPMDYFVSNKRKSFDWNKDFYYTMVHALDSKIAYSFEEYYEELLKQAIGGAYHPKPPHISIDEALYDLALMVELKLAKVVMDEEFQTLQARANLEAGSSSPAIERQ